MLKEELRHIYLSRRKQLAATRQLTDRLLSHFENWMAGKSYQKVGSYKAMPDRNEPDMTPFEAIVTNRSPQAAFFYPRVSDKTMQLYPDLDQTIWIENNWHIAEPHNVDPVEPKELDIILCPLLISDKTGYRVGYGKGFYDQYLARIREDCIVLGISYFEPVDTISDIHQADIRLDVLISPEKIHIYPFTTMTEHTRG